MIAVSSQLDVVVVARLPSGRSVQSRQR